MSVNARAGAARCQWRALRGGSGGAGDQVGSGSGIHEHTVEGGEGGGEGAAGEGGGQ